MCQLKDVEQQVVADILTGMLTGVQVWPWGRTEGLELVFLFV